MDADRFDMIAKTLTTGRSRRGALGLLAGAAGLAVGSAAAAGRRGKRGGVAPQASESEACYPAVRPDCNAGQVGPGRNLRKCDFSSDDVSGLSFAGSNLERSSFFNACVERANLSATNLGTSCLQEADFTSANFRSASLIGADLTDAIVCGADFRGSNVTSAQLAVAIGATCCATRLPNGKPGRTCPAGQTCCGTDTCTDLKTDAINCGACGRACSIEVPEACVNGRCVPLN